MTTITVRARLLAAIAKWASTDDTRHHLNFVFFDGKNMVATDGHRLIAAPLTTDVPAFGLHRKVVAGVASMYRELGRKYGDLEITIIDRKAKIKLDGPEGPTVTTGAPSVDFPPYEQLFAGLHEETPVPGEFVFNSRYLADVHEVVEALDPTESVRIKAWSAIDATGMSGPMLMQAADGTRFLIMSKRGA